MQNDWEINPHNYCRDEKGSFILKLDGTPKRKSGQWVFGIYNLYNRKNTASIRFQQNLEIGSNQALRLTIFGIIPSVTYNFKF